ncbi:MAG: response regulator transcription factor [Candidatus Omnitrophica bacterium]|nr:response regulator transcription factor [Candidatus Omnitrophota bacterium]MDD5488611.1 response regulator transcription factor [Candidatus Omnitrophota bacterium]
MSKEKILIVEDDRNISNLVKYNLEKAGYACLASFSGEDALSRIEREKIDLIVLDIMLPEIDGLEVCRRVKGAKATCNVPVVMLTAKGEEVDRIVGLELGADDYIVKPFSPRELVLRVKAILKRASGEGGTEVETLEAGRIKIDVPCHKVTVDGKEAILTPMEFKLLLTLMERAGRVQSRERLLNDVWDISSDVTTRTIDTHIKRLREKLGKSGKAIETVRGIGYRFKKGN